MQTQYGADIIIAVLILAQYFLIVGIAQEGQEAALHAEGRLDDIGNVVLVLFLVEVGEILAAGVLVLGQVVVGAVGYAPQLAPAKGEHELKVSGRLGVEAQLLGIVVAQAQVLILHA